MRSYLHISYLASTWSPGLDKELAELAVQLSVLEQNAGRKEEMGQAGCCKVTPRLINHVISKVKGTLTRHCELLFGVPTGTVREIGRREKGRRTELWASRDVSVCEEDIGLEGR
jgi:hypothetical protein